VGSVDICAHFATIDVDPHVYTDVRPDRNTASVDVLPYMDTNVQPDVRPDGNTASMDVQPDALPVDVLADADVVPYVEPHFDASIALRIAERHGKLLIVPEYVCVLELRQLPGLLVDCHLSRGHELHVDERLLLHGEWV